jgi:signal transduction histidine kinase/ligand-binding sensor domain-containing protein
MKSCFTVLVVLIACAAFGQAPPPQQALSPPPLQTLPRIQFEKIGIEHGLSQSTVYSVLQDKTGFLWFATQDGLNRFDGYTFRVYRKEASADAAVRQRSLTSNWILGLYQGSSGRFWVITRSGVDIFNPATDDFTPFHSITDESAKTATSQRLNSNNLISWTEDRRGDFWIGSDKGLNHYNAASRTMSDVQVFHGMKVFAVKEDSAGQLWVATAQGLFRLARPAQLTRQGAANTSEDPSNPNSSPSSSYHFVPYALPLRGPVTALGEDRNGTVYAAVGESPVAGVVTLSKQGTLTVLHPETAFPPELLAKSSVQGMYCDERGWLWLRTSTGVLLFNPREPLTVTALFNTPADPTSLSSNAVSVLTEDAAGVMWIGTAMGLNLYNPATKALTRYLSDPAEPSSLSSNIVRSIVRDRFGTMWVGTDIGGANMWNAARQQFTLFRRNPYNPNTLSDNSVRAFAEETPTTFWVGTDNGLNLVNIATGRVERIPTPQNQSIRALYKDLDGSLWLGTVDNGLLHYNIRKRIFEAIAYNPLDSSGLSSGRIRVIFRDSKKQFWIGAFTAFRGNVNTNGSLVMRYDEQRRTFTRLINPTNPASLSNSDVRCITEDSKGRLWIGTYGGLIEFTPEKNAPQGALQGRFRHFHSNPDDPRTLANDIISCVKEDAAGRLWVGTAGGLNVFDPETGFGRRFTTRDGLPNDFIYGIVEDGAGNLWLTTNTGVSCFNPRTNAFRNFDVSDGLQGNEFNAGAHLRTSTGALLVGGITGFNVIQPDAARTLSAAPQLVLTSFRVMNKERVFERPLNEVELVTLQHLDNLVAVEFAALDYIAPAKVEYAYKLEGIDKDWVQAGHRRYASYGELEPGEYVFCVKAVNKGVWPPQERRLRIVLLPPFWRTWWFQALMLVVVVVSVWGAHRIRLRGVERQNRLLQTLVEERTKELRSTNEELTAADEEIRRQNAMLEEQTVHIELSNTELQHKNVELVEVNEQLEIYGREMERYSKTLEEQGREIELVNSELHEKNSQLAEANAQLEALNQRKNELLGIVAHDLKNPLSTILMSATMVQRYIDRMKPDDVLKSIGNIRDTGDRMHRIIVDLLDVEAIESGKFKLVLESINIVEAASQAVQDYAERAAQKSITLYFQSPKEQLVVSADDGAVRQILDNILSNALKYSPPDKCVWVTVQEQRRSTLSEQAIQQGALIHDTGDMRCVQVVMRDEGPGLSAEDQQKLFGRFAKLTPRPTAGEHSTGLGLSIVKQLVEAMGGRVWCESEIGRGAAFVVELPLEAVQ